MKKREMSRSCSTHGNEKFTEYFGWETWMEETSRM